MRIRTCHKDVVYLADRIDADGVVELAVQGADGIQRVWLTTTAAAKLCNGLKERIARMPRPKGAK